MSASEPYEVNIIFMSEGRELKFRETENRVASPLSAWCVALGSYLVPSCLLRHPYNEDSNSSVTHRVVLRIEVVNMYEVLRQSLVSSQCNVNVLEVIIIEKIAQGLQATTWSSQDGFICVVLKWDFTVIFET